MSNYIPSLPFAEPAHLLIPTYGPPVKGVPQKKYPADGELFYCSYKTFGGTEVVKNDVLVVEDTGYVETWFRPDIKSDCRVKLLSTGRVYEIIGEPENINMRNQFTKFKMRALKGGA